MTTADETRVTDEEIEAGIRLARSNPQPGALSTVIVALADRLAARDAEVERLEALFQQTHGVHHSWVAKAQEADALRSERAEMVALVAARLLRMVRDSHRSDGASKVTARQASRHPMTDRPAQSAPVEHDEECERMTHPNSMHPCDCGAEEDPSRWSNPAPAADVATERPGEARDYFDDNSLTAAMRPAMAPPADVGGAGACTCASATGPLCTFCQGLSEHDAERAGTTLPAEQPAATPESILTAAENYRRVWHGGNRHDEDCATRTGTTSESVAKAVADERARCLAWHSHEGRIGFWAVQAAIRDGKPAPKV